MKNAFPKAAGTILFLNLLVAPGTVSPGYAAGTVVGWGDNQYGQTNVPVDLTAAVAVSAGQLHSLALRPDGTVVAWGDNSTGQTNVPPGLSNVVAIAAGNLHNLVLKRDGTVVGWGQLYPGQTVPEGLSNVTAIADGGSFSLVLKRDGSLVAWGRHESGEADPPVGLSNVVAISAGSSHGLALKADKTVVAWGINNLGQCDVPSGLTGVVAIACGAVHSLALKSDGTVVAWGWNAHGESTVPTGLTNVVAIAGGYSHSLALKKDGAVVGWGDNTLGQSSISGSLTNVVAIEAGGYHSLVLIAPPPVIGLPKGTVVGWGLNGSGQTTIPADLTNVVAISAGEQHSMVLQADGTVVAWGANGYGQTNVPAGLSNVVAIEAGNWHCIALRADGTVTTWGWNYHGQCNVPSGLTGVVSVAAGGTFSLALKADNTEVAWGADVGGTTGLSNVVAVAAGSEHALALKKDGTVVAWGYNSDGECNVPVGLDNVVAIGAGCNHSLAVKEGGTVVAWGANWSGQTNVPADLTDVVAASGGHDHSLALKRDRTVVAWGDNGLGQREVPVGLTSVSAISAGPWHSLALVATPLAVYDLSRDFSIASNPNGVWSYGWKSNPAGAYTPFVRSVVGTFPNGVPFEVWAHASDIPAVACNTSTNTGISEGGASVFPPGTVWFVGGWDGWPQNFCVIRFTVPSHQSGAYRLESEVRPQLDGPSSQDGDYHVVVNGVEVFGEFLPPYFVSGYTNLLVLAEGDTVDFLAGRGADGHTWGSGLKIQATLSLLTNIPPVPPVIVTQPQSQTVSVGTTVAFSVTVTGTLPFAYQWRKDGVSLPGATGSMLILSNVQSPNIGYYSVEVTNAAGSVTSASASLSIEGVPFGIWQGLAAFYPFNGNAADASGNGNNGTLIGTQPAQDRFGSENAARSFNGTSDYIEIPSSPSLAFGAQITASAWICPDRLYPPQYQEGFQAMQIVGKGLDVEGALDWMFSVNGDMERPGLMLGIWTYWDSARVVESNVWRHVVFTYDGSTMKTYVDAVPSGQYSASGPFRITDGAVRIGAYAPMNGIQSKCFFSGKIDGVRIYSRALSDEDVQQLYDSEKPPAVPPGIASQSPDQTVLAGTNLVLEVVASGPTPYSYEWFFNGTNLGATDGSLALTNLVLEQAGLYTVSVSNPYGSVTSAPIALTVLMAPVITTQPKGQTAYWGKSASFQVRAKGTLPLTYLWYVDGFPIEWATNATLVLTNLEMSAGGDYWVEICNSVDCVTSAPARLVMNPAGISLGLYPGVTVDGVVGRRYGIQYTTNVTQTNSWITLTNLVLSEPVQLWLDTEADTTSGKHPKRFYRVVPVP